MKKQDISYLAQLYNTLSLITTSGENTIIMGDCLKSLKNYIQASQKEMEESAQENNIKEE